MKTCARIFAILKLNIESYLMLSFKHKFSVAWQSFFY